MSSSSNGKILKRIFPYWTIYLPMSGKTVLAWLQNRSLLEWSLDRLYTIILFRHNAFYYMLLCQMELLAVENSKKLKIKTLVKQFIQIKFTSYLIFLFSKSLSFSISSFSNSSVYYRAHRHLIKLHRFSHIFSSFSKIHYCRGFVVSSSLSSVALQYPGK